MGKDDGMLRAKVLVVDEDRYYREQLMYALEEDYSVFDAEDRKRALEYLKEKMPDVVLTDLYLPPRPAYTTEGLALLKQFKEVAPKIKIIIVTAEERREIIGKCRELGADDFIPKPFEVRDLKNAIDRLVPEVIPQAIERRGYWRETDGRRLGPERRRYRRMEREFPISYSLQEDKPSVTGESKTINISATGLLFPAHQSITPHSLLDFRLSLEPKPLTIDGIGEVKWAKKVNGRYNIGVEFVEVRQEDRKRIAECIYA
jgi:DNA-binding response OmpR family regulator